MKIKRESLIKAAKELNEVMGLRPAIDIEEDEDVIKAKIIKALEFREEEDEFSPEAEKVFAQLEEEKEEEVEDEEEEVEIEDQDEDEVENEEQEEEKVVTNKRSKKDETIISKRLAFLAFLIGEGKYTRKELVEKTLKQFPGASKAAIQTTLSDAKNPKYNKFERLVVEDDKGIVSFADEQKKETKKKQ